MPSIFDWSSTASANTSIDGIDCNTGHSPANVDNLFRSMAAIIRQSFNSALQTFLNSASLSAARTNLGLGTAATLNETTAGEYRANTAGKVLSTDKVWAAAASVALTPGATVSIDLSTGFNFTLAMGGNYTLANPTNMKAGQSGAIEINQDATGNRTLAYGTAWKFAGGTAPVLTTTASRKDILFYQVMADGATVYASLVKDVR